MPTGYTYAVQEGKIDTLEDFAKDCARAFLWQARDSNEKDLVKLVTGTRDASYYENKLVEAINKSSMYRNMTDDEWRVFYESEYARDIKWKTEYREKQRLERERYQLMLSKVIAWNPPTEKHQELKNFMMKQLNDSIDFDCSTADDPITPFLSFDRWKEHQVVDNLRAIEDAKAGIKKMKDRDGDFLDWVNQLLESVKGL